MNHYLSKSTFVKGCQCPKALYLHKYHPELRDETSEMQQAVFDRGTAIGVLARQLFPGGINASPDLPEGYENAIKFTSELIGQDYPVIYEAGFSHSDLHCFVDILVKEKEGWHAYEVKSSTTLSHIYHLDAAFQFYVMRKSGLDIREIDIVLLDTDYIREGPLELRRLFSIYPVTRQILRLQKFVEEKADELKKVLSMETIPVVEIGPHCTDPYRCDFTGHCWKDMPEGSVFEVSGLIGKRKWELYKKGILRMVDIPLDFPLNPHQRLQVDSTRDGLTIWNTKELDKFLVSLDYPLYFLDFESFQPAVPLFNHTRPYQQVPFQYSLHILKDPGSALLHREYLAEAGPDPRPGFTRALIEDIGDEGDIIVYNKSFEKRILQDIIRDLPIFKGSLEPIIGRMKDLMEPFRQKHIYLPEMRGSYSIKNVLPALVGGNGYSGLEIADGGSASIAFESLFNDQLDPGKIEETRRQLLDYCAMDTLAMVQILEKIREGR